jgi:hypothetical protein
MKTFAELNISAYRSGLHHDGEKFESIMKHLSRKDGNKEAAVLSSLLCRMEERVASQLELDRTQTEQGYLSFKKSATIEADTDFRADGSY